MSLHIHIDAIGGLSGDMFIASMLDTFPELQKSVLADLEQAGILEHVSFETSNTLANGISAQSVNFKLIGDNPRPTHHYRHIKQGLQESNLNETILQRSIAIFDLLAQAEARVHGVSIEQVHFHEVADWDSQADIVAAASLIEHSQVRSWTCGHLPLGGGTVSTEHGELPIPAPATTQLLAGFAMHDDGVHGERITPTGAAILKHLVKEPSSARRPTGTLTTSGTGCGTKRFKSVPNIARLMVFDTAEMPAHETVSVIGFDIDDMTPEELSIACQQLRKQDGVLDVQHSLATGKKGRSVFALQILCAPHLEAQVVSACFAQTSTIGLRCTQTRRYVLNRTEEHVSVDGKAIPVKTSHRPDGTSTTKVESDALDNTPTLLERRSLSRQAEAGANNE